MSKEAIAIEELKKELCRHKEDSKKDFCRYKEKTDVKINELEKEVKLFSAKANNNEKELGIYKKEAGELKEYLDCLYIGQMCAKIQEYIYQRVLPEYCQEEEEEKLLVKNIMQEIEKRCTTTPKKTEAKQKWEELKPTIRWKDTFIFEMETFRLKRNEKAHPEPLLDDILNKIAERLTGQKQLNYKELLEVWKKLRPLEVTFTYL